jgi:hypothetical protein
MAEQDSTVHLRLLLSNLRTWVQDKPELQDVAAMFDPRAEKRHFAKRLFAA